MPAARPSHPPTALPIEDDQGDYGVAFDNMLDEEAKPAGPPAAQASCPECGELMAAGAVVCIACGYDQRSGKVLKTKRKKESAAGEAAMTAGKFVIGVILSLGAALIGVVVWITIAVMTGYEIGWIAWGLGGLVGLAMRVGYREETQFAGMVAAFIAFLGVAIVKGIGFVGAMIMRSQGEEIALFGLDAVFHPLDILFLGLAVATAYKVASGASKND